MIKPWRERLDWNAERSPSNTQIKAAMQAEINELRAVLKRSDAAVAKEQDRADRRIKAAAARATQWRNIAYATQKELNNERKRISATPVQREPRRVRPEVGCDLQTRWFGGRSPFDI